MTRFCAYRHYQAAGNITWTVPVGSSIRVDSHHGTWQFKLCHQLQKLACDDFTSSTTSTPGRPVCIVQVQHLFNHVQPICLCICTSTRSRSLPLCLLDVNEVVDRQKGSRRSSIALLDTHIGGRGSAKTSARLSVSDTSDPDTCRATGRTQQSAHLLYLHLILGIFIWSRARASIAVTGTFPRAAPSPLIDYVLRWNFLSVSSLIPRKVIVVVICRGTLTGVKAGFSQGCKIHALLLHHPCWPTICHNDPLFILLLGFAFVSRWKCSALV